LTRATSAEVEVRAADALFEDPPQALGAMHAAAATRTSSL
jgi:hypothetical protein